MPAVSIERLQAPTAGMNTDASPDYVPGIQAPLVQNMLPGRPGRVVMRGAMTEGIDVNGGTSNVAQALWTFDDVVLLKSNDGSSTKTWRIVDVNDYSIAAKTNVTATLVESPLDSRHARYGAYVYGAITDAAPPQLGRWNGLAAAIVPQANAPFQWTDLQVYAQRLFVLGGSVPGTTTPVNARTLYYTLPDATSDLSLLASWKDVTSGLVNQINYDGDDTPVGLAGCGRYMAIVGSRSINLLTGSGTSSFAIRNLTKNWGCTDIKSILEVDDGFYFMSERGYAFCDGATVSAVSDVIRDSLLGFDNNYAASFGNGFLALSLDSSVTWLFHIATRAWMQVTSGAFTGGVQPGRSVHRSLNFPLIWDGSILWSAGSVTIPDGIGADAIPGVTGAVAIPAAMKTRVARLSSPSSDATVNRVIVDYAMAGVNTGWSVTLKDEADTTLMSGLAAGANGTLTRQRAQLDVFAETDTAYLSIAYSPTGTPNPQVAELYDAWIEYVPARVTPGF